MPMGSEHNSHGSQDRSDKDEDDGDSWQHGTWETRGQGTQATSEGAGWTHHGLHFHTPHHKP